MASVTNFAHNVEITAEGLREELARLEAQKQALERETAAVVVHLGSVQRALSALEALIHDPASAVTGTAGAVATERAAARAVPQADAASAGSADAATLSVPEARKPESGEDAERPVSASADTDGPKKYGMLTEQIMEYFAEVGDVDVRARDVAAALGRDSDSGSINGVRSTLDRLVGTSRIQRTGRGLYRAARSQ